MLATARWMAVSVWLFLGVAWASPTGPYAGQEQRAIKALSAGEIQDILAGKGLGYAKAAELNHYPGPAHVLELAPQLGLSEKQMARTRAIFAAMQKDAMRHGQALVEKERELDRRFATGAIDTESLHKLLVEIAAVQAELRRVHLQAHLDQRLLLTPEQISRYDALRGYGSSAGDRAHGGHSH